MLRRTRIARYYSVLSTRHHTARGVVFAADPLKALTRVANLFPIAISQMSETYGAKDRRAHRANRLEGLPGELPTHWTSCTLQLDAELLNAKAPIADDN
jgi:hypothetical protein